VKGIFQQLASIYQCFGQKFVLRRRRNCYYLDIGRNSDIVFGFSDSDLLIESNNLVIRYDHVQTTSS